MNQCLWCKGPCETTDIFCNDCRALLDSRFQHNDQAAQKFFLHHANRPTIVAVKSSSVKSIPTAPLASIQDVTSDPPNEASLTELPTIATGEAVNDPPTEDADLGEDEKSEPVEQSDPLLARHLPTSAEAALIEEEDIQRAAVQRNGDTADTKPVPFSKQWLHWGERIPYLRAMPRRVRIALMAFVTVAALALILDGVLILLDVGYHSSDMVASKTTSMSIQTPGAEQTVVLSSPTTVGGQPTGSGSPIPGTPPFSPSNSPSNTPGSGTPLPSAPVLGISPLSFQFTATQGQGNPPGQQIFIGNTGNSSFYWQASIDSSSTSWLSVTPAYGAISAGNSIAALVNIDATGLTPGTYNGQITVTATDASGRQVQDSPQTALVTLQVLQPCTLQEAPASLSFTVSLLHPSAPGQNISFKETGNCARPVSWMASVDAGSRNWLSLSATSGFDNGNGSTIVVNVNAQGKLVGRYTGQITLEATDSNGGLVRESPQYIAVTLNVIV